MCSGLRQIDYYSVAGRLIGWSNGTTTTYDLTDAQGSVLTIFSSGAILGEQIDGPYGNQRSIEGSLGSDKGYTSQFADAVSGLDYYNARWYDPVMSQFLSADRVQGNAAGMDPYAYVAGNPETRTDPTGQRVCDPTGYGGCQPPPGPKHPKAGSPENGPGGCNTGYHPSDNGNGPCVQDGSNCSSDMHSGKGGCVYISGECRGLTSAGCTQFKIHLAQADAQQEVVHLLALTGVMLLLLADLAGWVSKLETAAEILGGLALGSGPLGLVVFGVLWALATGTAILLAGSMSTLAAGVVTDSVLVAMFQQRATDDNPADWTPAALSQLDSRVNAFTGFINNVVTPILTFFTSGDTVKLGIGTIEPTAVFYGFSGIDATLAQMNADMGE